MTSLLSRLQSATGPSRELDAEIALANGWRQLTHDLWRKGDNVAEEPPRYTESIDAALTLLPSWANCHGYDFGPNGADAYVSLNHVAEGHKLFEGSHASSTAIALLIAIERAKENNP